MNPSSASPSILFTQEGGIARIVLNRPDKRNSFDAAMHEALRQALDRVTPEAGVRVLLLTGAGQAFCAGQDLGDPEVAPGKGTVDLGGTVERHYAPLVRRLRALPLPVVCAVNGVAAGAGANIALACDLVMAKSTASFIQPFCRLGLLPDTGGTYFLPRLLGTARAMGLSLLGERLGARQAAEWGLIWRCLEENEYEAEVEALLTHLANAPTLGLARTKAAIYASSQASLDEQLAYEAIGMRELGRSHDYGEGVDAFLAKRPPVFQGR